jgi:hypothetical protein
MARGDWNGRNGNRDFDGKPGNAGESPSYSRIYDRRGESEYSNRAETSIQIRRTALEQQAETEDSAREALLSAQSRVHVFPSVGKFIIPTGYENTWAAHAELIKDVDQNLYFNPEKFAYFDRIIAQKLNAPALTDPTHPDYAKYEGLRTNLAVLRNDIVGYYVEDGSFDPGDEKYIPHIASIASAIADGLRNDTWYRRPFSRSISLDVANVEAIGARDIYKYLLSVQSKPAGVLEGLRYRFNTAMGIPNRAWNLAPLEDTPFSDAGLSAAPPPQEQCFTPTEMEAACAADYNRMVTTSESMTRTAHGLQSVHTLTPPIRETSVEEARTILRWLKNLQFTDRDMEEWMDHGTPAEQAVKAEALSRLVDIYSGELFKATRTRPEIFYAREVDDASEAAGGLAAGLALHTLNALPSSHSGIVTLDAAIDAMPPVWEHRSTQSVRRLLDTLETGLQHATRTDIIDQSPADRLLEMSARIRERAAELRSVHEMNRPAREESIELAREILRKMKKMQFSDRTLEEWVDTGTAGEKAAFAQKIDEMVETYHSLMTEAAVHNPNILLDARVKEASDAVGSFAHAVSLMAAKEIPNSLAAAQQISADITQMPEEWKSLHGKTVDLLVQSMEGGLEQAVHDMQMQQAEQQKQDEEIAQDTMEAAMAQSGHLRRKRRRRYRSGQSAGAQRKVDRDIKADDYALGQGRFRDNRRDDDGRTLPPAAMRQAPVGLRQEDLAAIRELGGNLRDIGQQAAVLSTVNVANVGQDDKLSVDTPPAINDLSFRQREQRDPKTSQRSGRNDRPQRDRI